MIVFIAGMQRSGSTFAFNIARDALGASGTVHQEAQAKADLVGALTRSDGADHVLVKSHDADALSIAMVRQGCVKVICTVRRVEDAVASWLEAFDWSEGDTIEYFRSWLGMFSELRGRSLILSYDSVDRRPGRAALLMARHLDPRIRRGEVRRIAASHAKEEVMKTVGEMRADDEGVSDVGFSYHDRNTFYHRRHVASLRSRSAEERLPREQVLRVRAALAAEIEAAGLGGDGVG